MLTLSRAAASLGDTKILADFGTLLSIVLSREGKWSTHEAFGVECAD